MRPHYEGYLNVAPSKSHRHHKPSGKSITTVYLPDGTRKDFVLGIHLAPDSYTDYNRICALVAANGGVYPVAAEGITVAEVLLAYWRHVEDYYRGPDGTPLRTQDNIRHALRKLKALYAHHPAPGSVPKT